MPQPHNENKKINCRFQYSHPYNKRRETCAKLRQKKIKRIRRLTPPDETKQTWVIKLTPKTKPNGHGLGSCHGHFDHPTPPMSNEVINTQPPLSLSAKSSHLRKISFIILKEKTLSQRQSAWAWPYPNVRILNPDSVPITHPKFVK